MMMGGSLILLLVVLAVAVWAIIKFFPDWQDRAGPNNRRQDSAEEILQQRFARGEIDTEEYEERHRTLREESRAAQR